MTYMFLGETCGQESSKAFEEKWFEKRLELQQAPKTMTQRPCTNLYQAPEVLTLFSLSHACGLTDDHSSL